MFKNNHFEPLNIILQAQSKQRYLFKKNPLNVGKDRKVCVTGATACFLLSHTSAWCDRRSNSGRCGQQNGAPFLSQELQYLPSISYSPQLHIAEAKFQESVAERVRNPFLYPAPLKMKKLFSRYRKPQILGILFANIPEGWQSRSSTLGETS